MMPLANPGLASGSTNVPIPAGHPRTVTFETVTPAPRSWLARSSGVSIGPSGWVSITAEPTDTVASVNASANDATRWGRNCSMPNHETGCRVNRKGRRARRAPADGR